MNSALTTTELNGFQHIWMPPASGAGNGAPTLLLLHGTGGDERDLLELGATLLPGAGLLSPRGRVVENGRFNRFFRRLAEGVFDVEDLKIRTDELADFIRESARQYGFDPKRVIAVGFSNGANIAASLLLSGRNPLSGAVLLAPMVPFIPETAPDLAGVPVFIGAGRIDPLIPVAETERLAELLRGSGDDVEVYFHNGGHTVPMDEVQAAQRWVANLA